MCVVGVVGVFLFQLDCESLSLACVAVCFCLSVLLCMLFVLFSLHFALFMFFACVVLLRLAVLSLRYCFCLYCVSLCSVWRFCNCDCCLCLCVVLCLCVRVLPFCAICFALMTMSVLLFCAC